MHSIRILLVVAALMMPIAAQSPTVPNNIVDTIGFSFVDQDSSTNVTTITLGDTIEWNFISGFIHTITSGTGSSDPDSGALFDEQNFQAGDLFFFTPTDCGVIPYYCLIHEGQNMVGTIIVESPPVQFPGSGDDLLLRTGINETPNCIEYKFAFAADQLDIELTSPNGTFNGDIGIIGAQFFQSGAVNPGSPPGLPGLHLAPGLAPGESTVLRVAALGAGGITVGGTAPFSLDGLTVILQGLVFTGAANNGILASTDTLLVEFGSLPVIND